MGGQSNILVRRRLFFIFAGLVAIAIVLLVLRKESPTDNPEVCLTDSAQLSTLGADEISGSLDIGKTVKASRAYVQHLQATSPLVLTIPVVVHLFREPTEPVTVEVIRRRLEDVNVALQLAERPRLLFPAANAILPNTPAAAGLRLQVSTINEVLISKSTMKINEVITKSRGGISPINTDRQLNLYFAPTGASVASFPLTSNADAIVVDTLRGAPASTILHELGHYMGLHHVWESNKSELGMNPPPGEDAACPKDSVRRNDIQRNYLNYTSDPCRDIFTMNQVNALRGCLLYYRTGLISSQVGQNILNTIQATRPK